MELGMGFMGERNERGPMQYEGVDYYVHHGSVKTEKQKFAMEQSQMSIFLSSAWKIEEEG